MITTNGQNWDTGCHSIEFRCRTLGALKKCGRFTRGGEATSCGQILNKGDKENKSLQHGDCLSFEKCNNILQWKHMLGIEAFIFYLNDERDPFIYSKNKSTIVRVCERLEIGYKEKSMRKKVILFHPMCKVKKS